MHPRSMRRGGLLLTLWLVVAGSAIAIGTWALSLVGGEISNGAVEPMSQTDVDHQLDRAMADQRDPGGQTASTSPAVTPGATPAPTTTVADPGTILTTAGGWIRASCQSGQVVLHGWSPAQGYRTDDVRSDLGTAEVKFESERAADVIATVWCEGGQPTVSTATKEHGDTSTPTTGHSSAPPPSPSSPTPEASDDHGSGGHGADDGSSDDDHHRRGQGDGGG